MTLILLRLEPYTKREYDIIKNNNKQAINVLFTATISLKDIL